MVGCRAEALVTAVLVVGAVVAVDAYTPVISLVLHGTSEVPETGLRKAVDGIIMGRRSLKEMMTGLSRDLGFMLWVMYTTGSLSAHTNLTHDVVGVVEVVECGARIDEEVKRVLRVVLGKCPGLAPFPSVLHLQQLMEQGGGESVRALLRKWVVAVVKHGNGKREADGGGGGRLPRAVNALLIHHTNSGYLAAEEVCPPGVIPITEGLQQVSHGGRFRDLVRRKTRELLDGYVMSIVLKHRTPYVYLQLDGRQVKAASGILIELLHALTHIYNFTYTLKLPDDDQWGSISTDGSWNGMVGEVHRNEQDMALGPTSITEEREKAIDFTTPFDFEPWDIMIPAAQESVDLFTFLMPFSPLVWVGVAVSWVVVGVVLYIISRPVWSTAPVYPYPYTHTTPRPLSLLLHLLNSLGSLVAQSIRQPQTEVLRVLSGWWWMVCVIMIASYSSKLIASITVRFTSPPVTSMLQMVQNRPLLWTYQANSAMEELFKYSEPNSMFGKVGGLHRDMQGLLVYSFKEGVEAVRKKKFAYIEDASLLEAAVEEDLRLHGSCRMSLVGDRFFSTRFGMILQRGSPYRQAFTME